MEQECMACINVVLRILHRLGCAEARCKNWGPVIYCACDPPGDIAGKRPYWQQWRYSHQLQLFPPRQLRWPASLLAVTLGFGMQECLRDK